MKLWQLWHTLYGQTGSWTGWMLDSGRKQDVGEYIVTLWSQAVNLTFRSSPVTSGKNPSPDLSLTTQWPASLDHTCNLRSFWHYKNLPFGGCYQFLSTLHWPLKFHVIAVLYQRPLYFTMVLFCQMLCSEFTKQNTSMCLEASQILKGRPKFRPLNSKMWGPKTAHCLQN